MKQSEFLNTVMPFKDKVYRLAKRLLVSSEEAEDATQELFMKLWNRKDKLSSYKSVEAFAMTMTKNYCFDRLKSKQASNLSLIHSNYKENGTSLDRKTELNDSVSIVHQLIAKLPENQRIIIQLRDVEEYEYEEISKVLDIKPTAVRVALSRARKTIREQLIKQHNYGINQN
ncbi:MAG: RNA polymerase sigma factor (sigma-70 family) [Candidatus Azotimanducaceae bacterium]|mgnify:CR=1 FL=1|jgi:RNA polymerase sigma factor (sigma-70 family)